VLATAAAVAALALVASLAPPRALAESSSGAYRLIVHPTNPARVIDRGFVAQAFLKKITHWPSGEALEPIDLDPRSPVRRRWSSDVLNRTVEAVKTYWQQMIFSGRSLPPPEVSTDEQVIDFVLHRPGAIGYVSADANLCGARALSLRQ
jgi:ABC-type phosphate transport system substrate-binding protein